MTRVKLSSKGQLVIPRDIRKALGLNSGTQFEIILDGQRIVLEPVGVTPPIEALYGKYPGTSFLEDLEQEHQHELNNE